MKRNDKRFSQRINTLGAPISIGIGPTTHRQTKQGDAHGYFDASTGDVVVGEHVPEPLRHVVLIHEFLHLVDEMVMMAGVTKRHISHDWIINASPLLLAVLTESGFWKDGPSLKEIDAAMRAESKRARAAERRKRG